MWESKCQQLATAGVTKYSLCREGRPASYSDVIAAWRGDANFREFCSQLLTDGTYAAYRWETPPVTADTLDQPFEFVILDCPGLARRVDATAFAERFCADKDVVAFPNLGGDAVMVVPCPRGAEENYGHLAAFLRGAPTQQRDELWRLVGESMALRVGRTPVWLSTAGMGVSWLHIRLDSRPKYYGHRPYAALA